MGCRQTILEFSIIGMTPCLEFHSLSKITFSQFYWLHEPVFLNLYYVFRNIPWMKKILYYMYFLPNKLLDWTKNLIRKLKFLKYWWRPCVPRNAGWEPLSLSIFFIRWQKTTIAIMTKPNSTERQYKKVFSNIIYSSVRQRGRERLLIM